ncbi:MAG: ABC transporter ATP-binding protein [Planctomycetota bacterium]|jgi:ATP-binding cassette subfamily B protein
MIANQHQDDEHHGRLDWAVWRRFAGHMRPYRPQLVGLALSGIVVAAVDTGFPLVTAGLIDEAVANGPTSRLLAWGAAYATLVVAISACVWVFITLAGQTATGVAHDLRRDGFRRLQELEFAYFDRRPVGWLVTRLTSDCTKISSLVPWFMLDLVWGTALLAGIVGAMLWLHWQLALVVLVVVPPLAIVTAIFQRKLLDSSRKVRRTNSMITAAFNEGIAGVRTTKALVREDESLSEFQVLTGDMYRHSMRNALQAAVYLPAVMALGSVGVGLALWKGGADLGAAVSIGELVAFMQYAALFSMPVQELARRFTDLQSAQAAAERVQGLLDTEPAIRDAPELRRAVARHRRLGAPAGRAIDGGRDGISHVEFRDVSFAYEPDEPVLEGFDLSVRAPQTVALVGATGGGKSTIVSLLARFYEPTGGAILVDGVDYRKRSLHWLQSSLGVVLQTPHLFNGTVRENIRYGRLEATDEEVAAAAAAVNADEFIRGLADGYATEVGEGGGRLSTGQRQLIALARAVLADPQIVIMDEATSSVDAETERLIQAGVETVLRGRLAFVIAHRLSTIRSADLILVIDGGRIVERGNHEALMARRGRYHALYTRQMSRELLA